jgi:hypothetical protein
MGKQKGSFTLLPAEETWHELADAVSASMEQTPETLVITFTNTKGDQVSLNFRRFHFDWHEKRLDQTFYCGSLYFQKFRLTRGEGRFGR